MHWREYEPEYDMWLLIWDLDNVINLIKKYDEMFLSYTDMMKATDELKMKTILMKEKIKEKASRIMS